MKACPTCGQSVLDFDEGGECSQCRRNRKRAQQKVHVDVYATDRDRLKTIARAHGETIADALSSLIGPAHE